MLLGHVSTPPSLLESYPADKVNRLRWKPQLRGWWARLIIIEVNEKVKNRLLLEYELNTGRRWVQAGAVGRDCRSTPEEGSTVNV